MICSKCGATVRDDVRFCTKCGQPLSAGPAAAPGPYQPMTPPAAAPASYQPTTPPAAAPQLKISGQHNPAPSPVGAPEAAWPRNPAAGGVTSPAAAPYGGAAAPGAAPEIKSSFKSTFRTDAPAPSPAFNPSAAPQGAPAPRPAFNPSAAPQGAPAPRPTFNPSSPTGAPVSRPAFNPSAAEGAPVSRPAFNPSAAPQGAPAPRPTFNPSAAPQGAPAPRPTFNPSAPQGAPAPRPAFNPSASDGDPIPRPDFSRPYTSDAPMRSADNSGKKSGSGKKVVGPLIAALLIIAAGVGIFFEETKGPGFFKNLFKGSSQSAKASDDSSEEAVEELVGYIQEADAAQAKAMSEYNALTSQDAQYFRDFAQIIRDYQATIDELQAKANKISGLDSKLDAAQKEYFTVLHEGCAACVEHLDFYASYMDFYADHLSQVPRMEDYPETNRLDFYNYYYAFDEWNTATKTAYSEVTPVPACLNPLWTQYGKVFSLSDSVLMKLEHAHNYSDPLCGQSARNMFNRFTAEVDRQYDRIWSCSMGEKTLVEIQNEHAAKIAAEIQNYADMSSSDREGFTFTSRTGELYLDYAAVDAIYPALYSTYDEFVVIKTGCIGGSKTIVVEAEIPGFSQPYQETFVVDSAYQEIYIKPPALSGDLNLTSAKDGQIQIKVTEKGGDLVEAKNFSITIQSKYDFSWAMDNDYGIVTRDNILCYLTPGASVMSEIRRAAIDEISDLTGGEFEAFVGYQDIGYTHKLTTYLHASGVMRALYEHGVRYSMDPFSIDNYHQHILLPEDVWNQKSGLCIETALTVASALQSANMHVFLIMPPGHAQVAVEVWDYDEGAGEYFLIETTCLSEDSNNRELFIDNWNSSQSAGLYPVAYLTQSQWSNYISKQGTYIIDCDDAAVLGMTPFSN